MNKDTVTKGYGVVVLKDDAVLLVRHLEKAGHVTGTYGLPAGRAKAGESEVETARRELWEETGLQVENSNLLQLPKVYHADIERSDGSVLKMSITSFLALQTNGEPGASVDEETEPEWVPIAKLDSMNLLPNVKYIVQDALLAQEDL